MSALARARIEMAVQRYDAALELRGVAGRQRRAMRRDLRANLRASYADVGIDAALAGIGRPESLAREDAAALGDPRRPAWGVGTTWGALAVAAYVWLAVMALFGFMDGAIASGVGHEVTGQLTLFPGLTASTHRTPTSLSGGVQVGWPFLVALLVIGGIATLLGARAWRVLRRPRSGSAPALA